MSYVSVSLTEDLDVDVFTVGNGGSFISLQAPSVSVLLNGFDDRAVQSARNLAFKLESAAREIETLLASRTESVAV